MGSLQWFLGVYLFGGLTFVPFLLGLLLIHAYLTLPPPNVEHDPPIQDPALLARPEDDKIAFKSETDTLVDKFHRQHDSDVAAGYFAVCREYVPGGVNGKPPDKLSPAGEVVAQESPSVYQTMYRSIFDRSQKPTIEPNKDAAGKTAKNANNVFYVVLRHGHLMLYDDIQQLEVRYVISLEYHDVDIYGGGEELPEGELWIKRHAIRLRRKKTRAGDTPKSLPFFLFSESLSEKEDFYFALLKNQEKTVGEDLPVAQEFDVQHIVNLVQKLHSSEEQLQTRWLNAMIGRLFLAMYKTPELENFIRTKLTKKISRVKKPNFITKLALQKIDTGTGAPFITNPRLKDLTVNGDCTVEADVDYTGHFRIEIAATARIELGSRFKPREVDMVLAATCKKLQGHALVRFKPPPSNRLWFSFEKMPQLDLVLEPIVSSRQITYTWILRAIESRIREVIAESICQPFWDDVPFFDTRNQRYRGGIWQREATAATSTEIPNEEPEDEAEAGTSGTRTPVELGQDDRVMSMPALSDAKQKPTLSKKSIASMNEFLGLKRSGSESPNKADISTPRLMRSPSLASAANPTVTADHADVNSPTRGSDASAKKDSVANFLKDLSNRSTSETPSPPESQAGSPPVESSMAAAMREKERSASNASNLSVEIPMSEEFAPTPMSTSAGRSSTMSSRNSTNSGNTIDVTEERPRSAGQSTKPKTFAQGVRSMTNADRKQALASVNAAAAAAQKWGWGVLARNRQRENQAAGEKENNNPSVPPTPREPMGRGRPLPPPGTPLPPPEKPRNSFIAPKRKPVPPPLLPQRRGTNGSIVTSPKPAQKPPLPERRKRQSSLLANVEAEDEVLVVEAPTESAPSSPTADEHHDEFFGHGEPSESQGVVVKPALPERPHDVIQQAMDEDDSKKEELHRQELGAYT
ncbi:uncharacterized protein PV06_08253 [Exophiala oligosperma]|uniref:SMP-LTD domain-containing protein n=2 Tax=Chaetothyriales TaxID=34395 RepID=A0A0D2BQ38_9EURO|nr:uncharacterized protein PV06_08253 [Exophiala oligosperma]KAJ9636914.1 hypothetical protein H2204_005060 [Knufia peltigerae]KIW39657.1 hypothetical protein PV06_08253 [Exophiala oligosperma]